MGFQLQPPTLGYWANYFLAKWDIYVRANPSGLPILAATETSRRLPLFKSENMEEYRRFRSLMQAVDLCQLDVACHMHCKLDIVAACLYIEVGLFYHIFTRQQISMTPDVQTLLISIEQQPGSQGFCELMLDFISLYFCKEVSELLPTLRFMSRFFGLDPSSQDFPLIIKQQKKSVRHL